MSLSVMESLRLLPPTAHHSAECRYCRDPFPMGIRGLCRRASRKTVGDCGDGQLQILLFKKKPQVNQAF